MLKTFLIITMIQKLEMMIALLKDVIVGQKIFLKRSSQTLQLLSLIWHKNLQVDLLLSLDFLRLKIAMWLNGLWKHPNLKNIIMGLLILNRLTNVVSMFACCIGKVSLLF